MKLRRLGSRDQSDKLFSGGLRSTTMTDYPAIAHRPNMIRESHYLIEIVADEKKRTPLIAHAFDQVFDRHPLPQSQRSGRFVQNCKPRTPGNSATDSNRLTLTS
jgi:hypothetical protein